MVVPPNHDEWNGRHQFQGAAAVPVGPPEPAAELLHDPVQQVREEPQVISTRCAPWRVIGHLFWHVCRMAHEVYADLVLLTITFIPVFSLASDSLHMCSNLFMIGVREVK